MELVAFEKIRKANSWGKLIHDVNELGFNLFPATDDVFAVNFKTRRMFSLSESGHYFPFLVERLGLPPAELLPEKYVRPAGKSIH
ncbi:hypothetical protein ACS8E9_17300 [Pseudomonas neustonica]|uniref:hypothetical protein n=1 Tax=Pseudomonas neustonica TaxID=2487346 RepID=UPI003F486BF6|tara:strand:+ start:17085 stop:17339 length:255 start_codon:yes stop_codon:yes gene_type:complete